ncbi:YcfL family protein [Sodalis sp. RH21]|uniref:YcfL family protein n=1 Tax=unclassified Sodalis (in: enterobacteria) TaxID=2636512 RepID=UPI0039B5E79E
MRSTWPYLVLAALLIVAGCSGSANKTLMINDRQTLIMDPSVMTAGIIAEQPAIGDDQGRLRAHAVVNNGQNRAVTVNYRFYWYDAQGLDILPFPDTRTVVVPPGTSVTLDSVNGNLEAKRVRLYLFL